MADFSEHPEPSRRTWTVSLWFWLCLLFAASLYGVVALTPGWSASLKMQDEYDRNQRQLVALEQRTGYLRQVVDALQTDPNFAAELARVDFDAAHPGDERIPVGPDLVLHASVPQPSTTIRIGSHTWLRRLLEMGAHNQAVRWAILGFSAVLVLFAFVLLPNPYRQPDRSATPIGWLARLKHRYTPHPDSENRADSSVDDEE